MKELERKTRRRHSGILKEKIISPSSYSQQARKVDALLSRLAMVRIVKLHEIEKVFSMFSHNLT